MNLPEQIAYFIDGGTHHRSIGHSGILTKDITQDMSFADKNTVDSIMFVANGEGVCFEHIDSWLTEFRIHQKNSINSWIRPYRLKVSPGRLILNPYTDIRTVLE